jgi:uncharacterized membrane protein YgdD (TMEM256/DUF423 family)
VSRCARAIAFAAAFLSLLAVILGALGSHLVDMNGLQETWGTAIRLHFFNAAGLLGLAALYSRHEFAPLKWGAWIIVLGTLLFAGSIYLHVITGLKISNMAPTGGILMMFGWLLAALAFLRSK